MSGIVGSGLEQSEQRSRRDEVLELIAKRLSLKEVANRLRIGESTVNYHVSRLKEMYGVNSLAQLAEIHSSRQVLPVQVDCSFSANRESAMSFDTPASHGVGQGEQESLITLHDALSYHVDAPWIRKEEPSVVPEVLEGTNAGLYRGAAIVVIALGMLALVLLGLGVAQGITAALESVRTSSA